MKRGRCITEKLLDAASHYMQAGELREREGPSMDGRQDTAADRYAFLEELSNDLGAYLRPEWVLEEKLQETSYTTADRINIRISQCLGKLIEEFGVEVIDPWSADKNRNAYRQGNEGSGILDIRILIRYPEK